MCFPFKTIGYKRIVEYTADEHNGFNAIVRREPVDVKIVKKVYDAEPGYNKPVANYISEPLHKNYVHAQPAYAQPQTYIRFKNFLGNTSKKV